METSASQNFTPQLPTPFLRGACIRGWLRQLILVSADYASLLLALLTADFIRGTVLYKYLHLLQPFNRIPMSFYFITPVVYILLLSYAGLYKKRLPFWRMTANLFRISLYAAGLVICLLYFTKQSTQISRVYVLGASVLCFAYLAITHYLLRSVLSAAGIWQRPVILVGSGKAAETLAAAFANEPHLGYHVVGIVADSPLAPPLTDYPLLGGSNSLVETVRSTGVREVVFALHGDEQPRLLELINRVQPHVNSISVAPNLFGLPMVNMDIETFFTQKALLLTVPNNLARPVNRALKRAFDLVFSLLGLILALPIMAVLCFIIRLDSRGSILYAHRRMGKSGKPFDCLKFRTMVAGADRVLQEYLAESAAAREEWNRGCKLKDDPRVTRVGRWLRRTSLDELPQLFNVLRGEMSMVGPRPITEQEVQRYGDCIRDYYAVAPGITGYWQVNGRNDVDYDARVKMDSWYVRNWSIWLDLTILIKTAKTPFRGRGAY